MTNGDAGGGLEIQNCSFLDDLKIFVNLKILPFYFLISGIFASRSTIQKMFRDLPNNRCFTILTMWGYISMLDTMSPELSGNNKLLEKRIDQF